LKEEEQKFT